LEVEAIKYYEIEIKRDPNYLTPYLNLAYLCLKKEENYKAINYLNEVSKHDPNFEGLNYALGLAFQDIDQTKSVDYMKTAARLGDENAKNWLKNKSISW
jgi:tetratricopeptide (TPR) repeat protein